MKRKAAGFTLVELMVAVAIGLLLVLVVTQAYISGLSTQRTQSDMGRLQESARFAFDALANGVRKAGYLNPAMPAIQPFCEAAGSPITPAFKLAGTNDASTYTDPSSKTFAILNNSDVLQVRYYGEGTTVAPVAADGSIVDCLGNGVAPNSLVTDTFFVAADADNGGEPSLFCNSTNPASTGNGSVPIIPGIESFQVLFGDNATLNPTSGRPTGVVERYIPAGLVGDMNNVRSLMFSVVVRSPSAIAVDKSTTRKYNHFGAGYAPLDVAPTGDSGSVFSPGADGRIRQQSSTTVALRNVCPT